MGDPDCETGPVSQRWVAVTVTGVGVVVLLVLAAVLVPWHPVPGGAVTPVPAQDVFSAAQIDRAESLRAAAQNPELERRWRSRLPWRRSWASPRSDGG